ncbi:PP2C family protein-serine/threonine phosphatase [Streptomyces chiangmaiensis]
MAAQTSLAQINGGLARTNHMQQFIALIALSALAVLVCFAWERHQRTLERVRTVSEAVQQVLLPPLPPHVGVVRTASHYLAAAEAAQVGGDLYAVTRVPGRCTRIILGDARGHGLEAVPDASRLINAFWETAHRWAPLPEIVADMEASVCCRLSELPGPGTAIAEHLITAVVVEIPDDHGPALIVNCGHPPPLLLHEGVVTTLEACEPTPPMGLCELTGCPRRADPVPFAIGDMLLLYTDGVIEARDTEGSFYPRGAHSHLYRIKSRRTSRRRPPRLAGACRQSSDRRRGHGRDRAHAVRPAQRTGCRPVLRTRGRRSSPSITLHRLTQQPLLAGQRHLLLT